MKHITQITCLLVAVAFALPSIAQTRNDLPSADPNYVKLKIEKERQNAAREARQQRAEAQAKAERMEREAAFEAKVESREGLDTLLVQRNSDETLVSLYGEECALPELKQEYTFSIKKQCENFSVSVFYTFAAGQNRFYFEAYDAQSNVIAHNDLKIYKTSSEGSGTFVPRWETGPKW